MEATEAAILGLIQTFCDCSVDNTKFHNSTTSCSGGTVTFSSTLAHASDDGSVTATVLIETFEAALAKAVNPTINVDGEELVVYADTTTDDDCNLFGTAFLFILASSAAFLMCMAIVFIIIW